MAFWLQSGVSGIKFLARVSLKLLNFEFLLELNNLNDHAKEAWRESSVGPFTEL